MATPSISEACALVEFSAAAHMQCASQEVDTHSEEEPAERTDQKETKYSAAEVPTPSPSLQEGIALREGIVRVSIPIVADPDTHNWQVTLNALYEASFFKPDKDDKKRNRLASCVGIFQCDEISKQCLKDFSIPEDLKNTRGGVFCQRARSLLFQQMFLLFNGYGDCFEEYQSLFAKLIIRPDPCWAKFQEAAWGVHGEVSIILKQLYDKLAILQMRVEECEPLAHLFSKIHEQRKNDRCLEVRCPNLFSEPLRYKFVVISKKLPLWKKQCDLIEKFYTTYSRSLLASIINFTNQLICAFGTLCLCAEITARSKDAATCLLIARKNPKMAEHVPECF